MYLFSSSTLRLPSFTILNSECQQLWINRINASVLYGYAELAQCIYSPHP